MCEIARFVGGSSAGRISVMPARFWARYLGGYQGDIRKYHRHILGYRTLIWPQGLKRSHCFSRIPRLPMRRVWLVCVWGGWGGMSEPLINLVVVCWPLAISNRHHQLQYHYHQKGKENIRTKWKWKWQTVPTWWYHKSVRSSEMRSGLASGFQTRWRFSRALPPIEKKTQWVGKCRTKSRMDYFHCWV